jgi:hypothetical protein
VSSQMRLHVRIGGKVCSNAVGEALATAPGSGVGHVGSMIVCMTAQISIMKHDNMRRVLTREKPTQWVLFAVEEGMPAVVMTRDRRRGVSCRRA